MAEKSWSLPLSPWYTWIFINNRWNKQILWRWLRNVFFICIFSSTLLAVSYNIDPILGAGANFSLCSGSFYQARIKAKAIAINTFIPKNGYRPVEVNPYAQQRYTSYYIPPVYSPQQQFPLYSLITPQAWSATHSFIDPALVRMSYCVLIGFGKEEVKQVLSCILKMVNSQLFLDLRLNQDQQISTGIKFSYLCLILTFFGLNNTLCIL